MSDCSEFVDVEVPFITIGNHQVLTDLQVMNEPWLAEFIEMFANCFEYDAALCGHIFYPGGKPTA